MGRLGIDDYLWHLAFEAAKRGTCDRLRAGCVIARNGKVIATGYNGSADGEPHCDDVGHELVLVTAPIDKGFLGPPPPIPRLPQEPSRHCVRAIHAEVNAIINAASIGISIAHADWYITGVPCQGCSCIISRLKPKRLFFRGDVPGSEEDRWYRVHWWQRQWKRKHYPKLVVQTRDDLVRRGVIDNVEDQIKTVAGAFDH